MSREYCSECTRPISECYCSAIETVSSPTKVTIIQHPSEVDHPYNTGRIVHRSLESCELIIAEQLSDEKLSAVINDNACLLFPNLAWLPTVPAAPSSIIHLIVIDATWKKAKKILHVNPELQQLPRLALTGHSPSRYHIRKGSMQDGLSTIESIVYALEQQQPDTSYQALLKPFEKMVELAQRYKPN